MSATAMGATRHVRDGHNPHTRADHAWGRTFLLVAFAAGACALAANTANPSPPTALARMGTHQTVALAAALRVAVACRQGRLSSASTVSLLAAIAAGAAMGLPALPTAASGALRWADAAVSAAVLVSLLLLASCSFAPPRPMPPVGATSRPVGATRRLTQVAGPRLEVVRITVEGVQPQTISALGRTLEHRSAPLSDALPLASGF